MKYCCNCRKEVNVNRNVVSMGFAEIWNDNCESCNVLIDTGFRHLADLVYDGDKFKIKQGENNEQR
jgi:hypothetical protein